MTVECMYVWYMKKISTTTTTTINDIIIKMTAASSVTAHVSVCVCVETVIDV